MDLIKNFKILLILPINNKKIQKKKILTTNLSLYTKIILT